MAGGAGGVEMGQRAGAPVSINNKEKVKKIEKMVSYHFSKKINVPFMFIRGIYKK